MLSFFLCDFQFHCNMEEKYQNCSLSVVQRYVYIICDHCCYYLNIGIIPGKHSRIKCDTNRRKTEKNIEARAEKNQINSVLPDVNFLNRFN